MEIQHAFFLKNYPNAHRLSKRHRDAIEWRKIVEGMLVGMLLVLMGLSFLAWKAYRAWDQRATALAAAQSRISNLSEEIARQQLLNVYSTQEALRLAAAMQKVVLSGSGSQQDFLEVMVPEAMKLQISRGIPASATLAMSIYESGYGKSELAVTANNFFGLKAFESVWDGPKVYMETRDLGQRTMAYFRSFPDVEQAVKGYADFLQAPRYGKAFEHRDGPGFVAEVLKAGYCPDRSYLENIKTIMERHHLQELDMAVVPQVTGKEVAGSAASGSDQIN